MTTRLITTRANGNDMPAQAPKHSASRRARNGRRTETRLLWLFVLPASIVYGFIVLLPTLQGIFFSMTNWDGLRPEFDFVGFRNFALIFADPVSIKAITNTLMYAVLTTVFENLFGLLLALALHSRIRSRNVLRVVFFLPVVILSIVVAYLWEFIFLPGNGVFTQVLHLLGFSDADPNMLGSPDTVVLAICIMVVWQFSGYTMIIYLAGLQGVPREQLEAASLDGAGSWSRFWNIVRPALAPALTINLILSMIRGFMIFDQIWATTLGGPADTSHSLSTLVYRTAFQFGKLGQGAALAVVLTIFVAILGVFQYRSQLRMKGNQ
jgi:raffinose/stachyose/melibiose transport system permease protein